MPQTEGFWQQLWLLKGEGMAALTLSQQETLSCTVAGGPADADALLLFTTPQQWVSLPLPGGRVSLRLCQIVAAALCCGDVIQLRSNHPQFDWQAAEAALRACAAPDKPCAQPPVENERTPEAPAAPGPTEATACPCAPRHQPVSGFLELPGFACSWTRVEYPHLPGSSHYYIGHLSQEGAPAGEVLAVPGRPAPKAPAWLQGFQDFAYAPGGQGYWLFIKSAAGVPLSLAALQAAPAHGG